jgi:hypothetical protein
MSVHTRWHKFLEAYESQRIGAPTTEVAQDTLDAIKQSVVWTVDDPAVFILPVDLSTDKRDGLDYYLDEKEPEQYRLLADNKAIQLPFDQFVVEQHLSNSETHIVCVRKAGEKVETCAFRYFVNESSYFWECSTNGPHHISLHGGEILCGPSLIDHLVQDMGISRLQATSATNAGQALLKKLLLLMATKGMVQQRIDAPKALNDKRVKKGKPRIPNVIYMRPGHYYDRAGNRHDYDERKPVAIHWRRGHIRNVWCGTSDNRRREPRYIQPCLVNYDGGDVPEHKVRVLQ